MFPDCFAVFELVRSLEAVETAGILELLVFFSCCWDRLKVSLSAWREGFLSGAIPRPSFPLHSSFLLFGGLVIWSCFLFYFVSFFFCNVASSFLGAKGKGGFPAYLPYPVLLLGWEGHG